MYYDLFVLAILIYFTIRGAMKGVIWQVAGLAGIILCFMFADGISAAVGPHVQLQEPLNSWVVLFGAYIFFSFIAFGIARLMNEWVEKAQLKEFNRHLGAIFGFIKGVALCMIMTFLIVTVSADARTALKDSRSGYYSAHIMNRLHPIMPEALHTALNDYIHALDFDEYDLPPVHDHDHDHDVLPPGTTMLGQPATIPNSNQNVSTTTSGDFWSQLRGKLTSEAQRVVASALAQQTDGQSQSQLEQSLLQLIQSTPTSELPQLQRELLNAGAQNLDGYLAQKLGYQPGTNTTGTNSTTTPSTNTSTNSSSTGVFPTWPQTSTQPKQPAIDPLEQIIGELAKAYPSQPGMADQLRQAVEGLPKEVGVGVYADLKADFFQQQDPDPQTTRFTPFEVRVMRQLSFKGISTNQLSVEWQQRLQQAMARLNSGGAL